MGDPGPGRGQGDRGSARIGEQVEDFRRRAGRRPGGEDLPHPAPVGGLLGKEAGVARRGAADGEAEAVVLDRPAVRQGATGLPAAAADPAVEPGLGGLPGRLREAARAGGSRVGAVENVIAPAFETPLAAEVEEPKGRRNRPHAAGTIARLVDAVLCSSGFVDARTPYLASSRKVGVKSTPLGLPRTAESADVPRAAPVVRRVKHEG